MKRRILATLFVHAQQDTLPSDSTLTAYELDPVTVSVNAIEQKNTNPQHILYIESRNVELQSAQTSAEILGKKPWNIATLSGTPAWYRINCGAQFNAKNYTLSSGVNNLLDHHIRTFSSGVSQPGIHFWLRVDITL